MAAQGWTIPAEELRKHFNNIHFSDVTVSFGDHEIYAHKLVLSVASEWFRNEIDVTEDSGYDCNDIDICSVFVMEHWQYSATLKFIYGFEDIQEGSDQKYDVFLFGMFDAATQLKVPAMRSVMLVKVNELFQKTLEESWKVEEFVGYLKLLHEEMLGEENCDDHPHGELFHLAEELCVRNIEKLMKEAAFKGFLKEKSSVAIGLLERLATFK